jgi:cardiolipin synthase
LHHNEESLARLPNCTLALVALGLTLGLGACVSAPDSRAVTAGVRAEPIEVRGARGPLTPAQSKAVLDRLAAQAPDADALARHLALEQAVADNPLYAGNEVHILTDGAQTFPAIFNAIRSAKRSVHLEYYIFEEVNSDGTQLSDLLLAKRAEGVAVDIIYDDIGSMQAPRAFFDKLRAGGVRLLRFNPVNPFRARGHLYSINDRDHRKLALIDGETAITGGINLSSTYESLPQRSTNEPHEPHELWRDTDIEIRGPVVPELERLFQEHWRAQHGPEPLPEIPADAPAAQGKEVLRIIGSSPRGLAVRYYVTVLSAIRNAERSIDVTAAYFSPTPEEEESLIAAARRGVDVRLLVPQHSDSKAALAVQRAHYGRLLQAGVKIYERDDGILHSKTMVIDDVWSVIGSSNFDHRSVLFNDEVDVVALGRDTAMQLHDVYHEDLDHAHAVQLEDWKRRSGGERAREAFWRIWEWLL